MPSEYGQDAISPSLARAATLSPGSRAHRSQVLWGPMTDLATDVLYYGDNLDIRRRYPLIRA